MILPVVVALLAICLLMCFSAAGQVVICDASGIAIAVAVSGLGLELLGVVDLDLFCCSCLGIWRC